MDVECVTLDFETTAEGEPIARGDVLHDVYAGYGVDVRVWRGDDPTERGLAVAFDSAHPTGGDWDLAFEDQGNLLISQECFDDADVIAGYVEEPDDDAHGAVFEILFPEEVCVSALTLLDIDVGEVPTDVTLFGAGDAQVGAVSVEPLGNNTRDVVGLGDTCGVRRIVVSIPKSGAVDDIVVCPTVITEEPPNPEDPEDPGEDDDDVPPADDMPPTNAPPTDDDGDDTEDPDDTETPPSDVPATDDDDTEDPDDTEAPPSNDEVDTEPPPGDGDTEPAPAPILGGGGAPPARGFER